MRQVEVKGLRELKASLNALPQNIATNVLRGAVNAGARVIRDEAKIKAPVETGTLKRAIYTKFIRELSDPWRAVYFVGVRQGKRYANLKTKGGKDKSMDAYYAKFVEYGHYSRPAGKHRMNRRATSYSIHSKGDWLFNRLSQAKDRAITLERMVAAGAIRWIPAHPFMRPAWDAKQDAALEALKGYMEKRIPAEVAKSRR
jgi:HK97 gp10 family phage protein